MDDSASDAVRLALRRYRVPLIALLILLALYAVAGFWLVPRLIRSGIEQYVSRDLGRRISIGEVRFNPFSLAVEIRALALSEADGTPLVRFRLLRIEAAALRSLVYRAYTLSEVRLEQPDVRVRIGADGVLNLSQLKPPASAAAPTKPGPLPSVRIGSLAVVDGTVGFEDRSRGEPFTATLRPIEFALHDFRTTPKFENAYQFAGETLAGERLSWSGEFAVQPLGSNGRFSIVGLKAATVAAYLQDALPFDLPSGSLDLSGEYRIALSSGLGLSLELPKLELRDIGIAPRGGDDTPWINVPQLDVLGTQVALADRRVNIERVNLDGARVQLWREPGGTINLQRLISPRTAATATATPVPTAAPPVAPAAPWTVSVGTVALTNGQIAAEDRSTKPAVELPIGSLALTVTGFSTQPAAAAAFTASATLGAGGQLNANGKLQLQPLNADTQLELTNLDLVAFQPYAVQYTQLQLNSGQLSVKGHVHFAAAPARGAPALAFQGGVTVANLATVDLALQQDLVKWLQLQISGIDYQQGPDRLSIARIAAREPYARVIIGADGRLNVKTVLSAPGAAPAAAAHAKPVTAAAAAAPPMPIRIGVVSIERGTANFTDLTVLPNFSASMTALGGTVTGLSSDPATRADVKISGSVDTYAPVEISGQLNPLAPALYCDMTMSFHNIDLTTFNPYSGKFAGYNITKGKLSTDMHYKIEQRKLEASHHIVIDQLEFGAATESKQAVSLPVKLAVALLKDRNGVIDIPLPITGSLDDPDFHIAPVVWQVLKHVLEKVVLAPFSALASVFGGTHGEELSYVDFMPGSAALADAQAQKITTLAKALVERPQLKLDIPLLTETSTDDAAIETASLEQALPKLPATPSSTDPAVAQRQRVAALTGLYTQQLGTAPAYPPELAGVPGKSPPPELLAGRITFLEAALLPHYAPAPAQRADLGQARASAVQAAVLANTEIAPERVFLSNRTPTATAPQGAVRMELQLQ